MYAKLFFLSVFILCKPEDTFNLSGKKWKRKSILTKLKIDEPKNTTTLTCNHDKTKKDTDTSHSSFYRPPSVSISLSPPKLSIIYRTTKDSLYNRKSNLQYIYLQVASNVAHQNNPSQNLSLLDNPFHSSSYSHFCFLCPHIIIIVIIIVDYHISANVITDQNHRLSFTHLGN